MKPGTNNSRTKLYIFNLATDENNPILAFTSQWIIEFSKIVQEVNVFSTHLGKNSLPISIKITEIGGGSIKKRILGLAVLIRVVGEISRNRNSSLVFHHMSPRTAWLIGPLLKIFRVPQGLWYAHSNPTWELRLGAHFVDRIFSSTKEALPLVSNKARFIGQGINLNRFPEFTVSKRQSAVVSLGRVSRIKNNEALIQAISTARVKEREVHLIGPLYESESYLESLITLGRQVGVEVKYLGEISHELVGETLRNYQMCYTGNPNTVDKSVIEGALSGCFTISDQPFVLKQTGMLQILAKAEREFNTNLSEQIKIADSLNTNTELRILLRKFAAEKNDVKSLTREIITELRAV